MGGIFIIIIGFLYYIIRGTNLIIKQKIDDNNYCLQNYKQASINKRAVYLERYVPDQTKKGTKYIPIFKERFTNKEVVKKKTEAGLYKWYYVQSKTPMSYFEDKDLYNSVIKNAHEMKNQNKLWFVAENFWDDTIYRLQKNIFLFHTYLDDYRETFDPIEAEEWRKLNQASSVNHEFVGACKKEIEMVRSNYVSDNIENKKRAYQYFKNNNPLNQKVYKNMYPYQLHMVYHLTDEAKKYKKWNFVECQYVIRFMKRKPIYGKQFCISDKEQNSLWTKWYAITKEQFNKLTETECPYFSRIKYNTLDGCQSYVKQLNPSTIAFEDDSRNIFRITKAFDKEMNFVGEVLF